MKILQLLTISGILVWPLAAAPAATIGTFTGGDPGEGLDLDGVFLYAFDVNGTGGIVNGLTFTADPTAGITYSGSNIPFLVTTTYGGGSPSANDSALRLIMNNGRYANGNSGGSLSIDLTGLLVGQQYKVQLLAHDPAGPPGVRSMSYSIEGDTLADIDPIAQGSAGGNGTGLVVTDIFTAADTTLNIILSAGSNGNADDRNPLVNAITVEIVPEPATLTLAALAAACLGFAARRTHRA